MTTLLATIVVLGVLIFVHELGHFMAAKLVGIEVQRFSIGLGPKVWGFQGGETEYVFSAIPLGGYVKMGGMDDEVMERIEGGSVERRTPSPRDFDSKPIWARTFVISAGVIMNMVFAFLLYTATFGIWGIPEFDTTRVGEVVTELLPPGTEALSEIPVGARITEIGGNPTTHWGEVRTGLLHAPPGPLSIEWADPAGRVVVQVPEDREGQIRMTVSLNTWVEAGVGALEPGSPADKGGLEIGDRIVSVAGVEVETWWALVAEIERRPGARTEVGVVRDGRELTRVVTLDTQEEEDPLTGQGRTIGYLGIFPPTSDMAYTPVGFVDAVVIGYRETVAITALILDFLWDLVTLNVSPRSLGSIVTIGEASGQAAALGMGTFLRFMALFSVNLAILNLLPIPVLDGGHLVFLFIEAVRGKALSLEQRMRWSQVGFIVLLGIMVFALSNDFMRLFGL
ncbi:MAG: RIP metalloprotease RseP [Gemmatimonadetes bacterium]|nr:RIP metalloprotease RseP [Gemmatimonadota bacterium]